MQNRERLCPVEDISRLLDLALFVLNMLACDRVILSDAHLVRHVAGILFRHVEVSGSSR